MQVILGIFCHWILKQDALGTVSGIWVLLATTAPLHVGLYSSIAEEELSGNLMHGLNSTNGFLVDVLVNILSLGMHRLWQFHWELQVSMLVLKGDKEKHCQLLRQGSSLLKNQTLAASQWICI